MKRQNKSGTYLQRELQRCCKYVLCTKKEKETYINLEEVRSIGKAKGVPPKKLRKRDLIKSFGSAKGGFDCFATARNADCDQQDCGCYPHT